MLTLNCHEHQLCHVVDIPHAIEDLLSSETDTGMAEVGHLTAACCRRLRSE